MRIIDVPQGTPEWLAIRAGKVTGSRITDVMAKLKSGGEAAGRRNYRAQLVAEILTGQSLESSFVSKAMLAGNELEPFARAAYEIQNGVLVQQVGFIIHSNVDRGGASPDGLVGLDGMIEAKCPYTATHIAYLLAGRTPPEYRPQCQWGMACAERDWCDFISHDPLLPAHLQTFIVREYRDDKYIKEVEAVVRGFLLEVDDIIARLPQAPVVIPESVSVAG